MFQSNGSVDVIYKDKGASLFEIAPLTFSLVFGQTPIYNHLDLLGRILCNPMVERLALKI